MRSIDGKMRETDAADVETLLRIIQSIPSPKAEPVRQWLAGVGAERLAETADLTGLSEDQRRIYNRDRMTEYNKSLSAAAGEACVCV
jgi:DNA-damage-inducible protein D